MTDSNHNQDEQQTPEPNLAIRRLSTLVGAWQTEMSFPGDPSTVIHGQTTFEWLEEGPFLIVRESAEHPDFPSGIEIIGGDESTKKYSMLYFDSRGISRIYEISLSDRVWKLWRDAPDFSQRFKGTFSDDGNTIKGSSETSSDGSTWETDFDLTYKRADPA